MLTLTHGSLFSGIGGFDLASEWMGWTNVFHCEWNPFGQKILKHYWPNATSYSDITKTDFTIHRGTIDILTGGFPCQPYSQAGKRKGKDDERHLWPEMLRAIGEIQPSWVVGENVLGLVNWNGGMVFDEVQADLEIAGYEIQPFVLPACATNAPHRRDRVWFVAHRDGYGQHGSNSQHEIDAIKGWQYAQCDIVKGIDNGYFANSISSRLERRAFCGKPFGGERTEIWGNSTGHDKKANWDNFPTQSPVCNGNDGLSSRLDGITFPKWRNESIKAGGNAIVPQVVHQIFKAIEQYEIL